MLNKPLNSTDVSYVSPLVICQATDQSFSFIRQWLTPKSRTLLFHVYSVSILGQSLFSSTVKPGSGTLELVLNFPRIKMVFRLSCSFWVDIFFFEILELCTCSGCFVDLLCLLWKEIIMFWEMVYYNEQNYFSKVKSISLSTIIWCFEIIQIYIDVKHV